EYTFTTPGIYKITSYFSGNETYFSSRSAETLIYVTSKAASLILEGGTMTYGESFDLNPMLFSENGRNELNSTVIYSVTKNGTAVADSLISGNVFTPDESGTYVIYAEYNESGTKYTSSSTIVAGQKMVTLTAPNLDIDVDMSLEERKAALNSVLNDVVIPNDMNGADKASLGRIISLYSEPVKREINAEGKYSIDIVFPEENDAAGTAVYEALSKKYSFVLLSGTLTLNQGYSTVSASSGANGSVQISYTTTIEDSNTESKYTSSPLTVVSGTRLPVGAQVTVSATPAPGYGIQMWTKDGQPIDNFNGAEYTFTLGDENVALNVSFSRTYTRLNFSANDNNGTVSGAFANSTTPFNSGDQINSTQTVVLTATPVEDYVVEKWELTSNGKTDVVKAEDGTSNYTGNTVTVSGVNSEISYKVYFVAKETATVTVKFINKLDDAMQPVYGCGVKFNGEAAESQTNEFTFTTNVHDNVTISIDIPDNMLVDYWENAKTNKVAANAVEEISIYDISGSMEYIVYCETPVARKLTFVAEWTNSNANHGEEEIADTCTVTVHRNGSVITESGAEHPQSSEIKVTASAKDGYRIVKWTLNGDTVATNVESYTFYLNSDSVIKVIFEKKPVITIDNGANGTANAFVVASGVENAISSGDFVEFGDDVKIDVTPNVGYIVDSVKVNSTPVDLTAPAEGNKDAGYYIIDDVNTNTNIEVTYKALDTTDVTFGIVDKNGADTEGGLDGKIKASVNRNDIDSYKVENAEKLGYATPADDLVYEGSVVTFTATPTEGYKVSKWFLNGTEVEGKSDLVIEGNTATLTITNGMDEQDIMVQFDLIGEEITFSIDSEETNATISATFTPNGGTAENFVSGSRPATNGVVAITVENIADGYEIEGWYVNRTKVENETSATFNYNATVDVGADIYVKIIRSSYEVTFEAVNGTVTATVESGALVKGDTVVTFTAVPKEATGYEFTGWTVNGEASEETTETLILTITENTTVKATYKLIQVKYDVTYGVIGENGTLTLSGYDKSPASVNAGANLTFTATPATGYRVAGWYSNAEGTTEIAPFEQNTYSTENLVADMTVYVKFEPIPTYDITVNVEGLGTVTATVNGKAAEITGGKLTVNRYDDVVLTAAPGEYQYFAGWTVGETTDTNLTLTLNAVTADTSVTATFAASQNITLKTIVGEGGTMTVKAGYGNDLTELENINPETGIVINRGQKVVFEITPAADKMVKSWKVNDVEMTDYLDHEYIIENITADTTIEVEFEALKTFAVPSGTAQYTIENIVETPVDIEGPNAVRERGNVTFDVVPKDSNAITELEVSAGEGSKVETTKNADGTWTVTIEKVMANIVLNPTVVAGKPLIINCGEGGTVEVTLNGNAVTAGYAFKADDVITVKAKANSGYTLESLKLNDADFTSGKTYTVKADDTAITIDATFKAAPAGGGGGGGFGGGGGGGASATYPPVIEETDNGKLIVTPEEPSKGDEVVITPVPDPGYMLDKITVTDKNDKEIETEFNRDGTYSFEQPAGEVTIDAEFKKIVLPFEDVSDKAYYAEAVLWAVENGITTGVTPTLFMPDMVCTRAQAVTFLWRAAGSPAPKSADMHFTDVPENAYYYDAVIWALENGITTGTNDGSTFSPDMVCSRSQIVTLIARMEKAEKAEAENPFTDVKDTDYYYDSVLWAVDNYITNGTTETTFAPVKDCTRAEIVTFLWRAFR
ncbi:MAG: S-layer homology domain-containing protein, partial [Ruminococcaceae bacterium]|nr:S-layer homology domain-containing protein [Oscillospiraceae bacterium]